MHCAQDVDKFARKSVHLIITHTYGLYINKYVTVQTRCDWITKHSKNSREKKTIIFECHDDADDNSRCQNYFSISGLI